MKRKSSAIAVVFALAAVVLFALSAMAYSQSITLAAGGSQTIYPQYGTFISAATSNSAIATVTQYSSYAVVRSTGAAGTAQITLVSNYSADPTHYVSVTVGSSSANNIVPTASSVSVGNTITLNNSISFYNASVSSSNTAAATVSFSGGYIRVYGVAAGTATISGYYQQYSGAATISFSCLVTVTGGSGSVVVNNGVVYVNLNETVYSDSGQFSSFYSVSSADSSICSVTSFGGRLALTGNKLGNTRISGSGVPYGGTGYQVFDFAVVVQSSSVNSTQSVAVGSTISVATSYASCSVTSANSSIATAWFDSTYQYIYIRGVASGTTTLTVYPSGLGSYNITVNVTGGSGTLSQSVSLSAGGASTTLAPVYTACGALASSNTAVATAYYNASTDKIIVTSGSATGTATITGSVMVSGMTYYQTLTITATVYGGGTNNQSISVNPGSQTAMSGTFTSVSSINPANSGIATAYLSGNTIYVSGVAAGSTTITVTATPTGYGYAQTYTLNVTVGGNANTQNLNVAVGAQMAASGTFTSVSSLSSANSAIATTYFSGNTIYVTGVAAGTTTITATAVRSGYTYSQSMTIYVTVGGGTVNSQNLNVAVGAQVAASGTFTSVSALSSANTAIATTYFSGNTIYVTGVAAGSTTITATAVQSGYTYSQSITIYVTVGSGNVNSQSLNVSSGSQVAASGTFTSVSALSSANTAIATTYFSGNTIYVTGVSSGSTTITATAVQSGYTYSQSITINVTVNGGATNVSGPAMTVKAGTTEQTKAFYSVDSVTSSNTAIASVYKTSDNKLSVTGISPGTSTISASLREYSSSAVANYTFTVTVTANSGTGGGSATSGVYLGTKRDYSVRKGKKYALGTVKLDGVSLSGASRSTLLWVSSNPEVVSVDKYGKLYVTGAGSANIVALNNDGSKTNYIVLRAS